MQCVNMCMLCTVASTKVLAGHIEQAAVGTSKLQVCASIKKYLCSYSRKHEVLLMNFCGRTFAGWINLVGRRPTAESLN